MLLAGIQEYFPFFWIPDQVRNDRNQVGGA
jgi:hypothetical protein